MTKIRDIIQVHYPTPDNTESIKKSLIKITPVNSKNGITIEQAFYNTRFSLYITILNFGKEQEVTFCAGDAYPNSMLGDLKILIPNGISVFQILDCSRFEKADGSIDLDFKETFDGGIYAVARGRKNND